MKYEETILSILSFIDELILCEIDHNEITFASNINLIGSDKLETFKDFFNLEQADPLASAFGVGIFYINLSKEELTSYSVPAYHPPWIKIKIIWDPAIEFIVTSIITKENLKVNIKHVQNIKISI